MEFTQVDMIGRQRERNECWSLPLKVGHQKFQVNQLLASSASWHCQGEVFFGVGRTTSG